MTNPDLAPQHDQESNPTVIGRLRAVLGMAYTAISNVFIDRDTVAANPHEGAKDHRGE